MLSDDLVADLFIHIEKKMSLPNTNKFNRVVTNAVPSATSARLLKTSGIFDKVNICKKKDHVEKEQEH
jgi:hypothetical protein